MFSNGRCFGWSRTCQVFHVVTFVRAIDHRSARGQRRHIVLKMGGREVTAGNGGEESHEKASNHRNNAHWQHDALRCPFVSAFLASDCRFGRAGYGGCTGRAAGDARQRRRCGAQICTALRRRRYLLLSRAAWPRWRKLERDEIRLNRHCEEQSDEAIQSFFAARQSWIASLRSQ
jgi:hypothetical protein